MKTKDKSSETDAKVERKRIRMRMTKREKQDFLAGMLFISPILICVLVFILVPMIFSFVMSFHEWDIVTEPKFIGLENYRFMFQDDEYVPLSLRITVIYTLIQTPLGIVYTLFIASLLHTKIRFRSLYRTLFYLPSIVPVVASSALWILIFNPNSGLLNTVLSWFGIEGQLWLFDEKQVLWCLIIMSLWGAGGGIVINLSALQGVPTTLYESMELDGANALQKFIHLTVPMVSPIILYHAIMGIIANLQTFSQSYLMTGGGPNNASLFYMLHLYRNAFLWGKMGYACAMAWVLFFIIAIFTAIAFFIGSKTVYYEGA